jgi:hypothetical protein
LCSYTLVDLPFHRSIASPAEILEKQPHSAGSRAWRDLAQRLLQETDMSFASVVDRVRLDFLEMPEMELTLPQAVRLWSLGMDDCRFVIDSLVDTGFLAWTPKRTIVRNGRDPLGRQDTRTADISVPVTKHYNKSVWNK